MLPERERETLVLARHTSACECGCRSVRCPGIAFHTQTPRESQTLTLRRQPLSLSPLIPSSWHPRRATAAPTATLSHPHSHSRPHPCRRTQLRRRRSKRGKDRLIARQHFAPFDPLFPCITDTRGARVRHPVSVSASREIRSHPETRAHVSQERERESEGAPSVSLSATLHE